MLDEAECQRARIGRDPLYDGRFFTGVRTTGVYCRPVCPVRPARPANVRFFRSAAAAEAAGFRPWLIVEERALDGEGSRVEALALRVGVGGRQLTRLFARHLGASPSQIARTARVQRAKRLLDKTDLPLTEIALRAGFSSLRRFNAVFAETYRRPLSAIRRAARSTDPG